MSKRSRFFGMRWAVSGLVLAATFECLANPFLVGDDEESLAASPRADRPPVVVLRSDRRLIESDPPTPAPAPQIDEIRGDEAVPGRRLGFGEAANAFGHGDSMHNQLLRDFGNPGANPAGAPATGRERVRRGVAMEFGADGSSLLDPAQAMLREAFENALKLIRDSVIDESEMVNFSIAGVDFNLTLSGGRPSLIVNGSDVWPTIQYDPVYDEVRQGPSVMAPVAMPGQRGPSAGGNLGSAPPWASAHSSPLPPEIPQGSGSTDPAPLIVAKVREFVTDPMTIIIALGGLFFWLAYEIASAVHERRRLRRYYRRVARART